MDIGESTVTIAEHPTLGPVRIEIHQPSLAQVSTREWTPTEKLLRVLVEEQRGTNALLTNIYKHLTRPPWWRRFLDRIKRLCGIH